MKRRVVSQISEYLEPREMYELITTRSCKYNAFLQEKLACRDRALMSCCFTSGGRITAVVGGPKYEVQDGTIVKVDEYPGLRKQNLEIQKGLLLINSMDVVKRKRKTIRKYGKNVAKRDQFALPLERGLFENPFWDQLVPFSWLIVEYMVTYHQRHRRDRLFPRRGRAWQIVREATGKYPNWFRAQSEHFYGHYLLTDSVKLAKFLKIIRPEQTAHYIGYSWKDQLKDRQSMDFAWIQRETNKIRKRLK